MKKLLFTLACFLISSLSAMAQESLVATLSHEGDVTAFYGQDALIKAYKEASDGDVITLSSGVFNAVSSIKKSLTIRGAGWVENPEMNKYPTIINGKMVIDYNVSLRIESLSTQELIWFYDKINLEVIKCKVQCIITDESEAGSGNFNIIQSYVRALYPGVMSKFNCINSCVLIASNQSRDLGTPGTGIINAENCILANIQEAVNSTFHNCIFLLNDEYDSNYFDSSNTAQNCLVIDEKESFFAESDPENENNNMYVKDASIFKKEMKLDEIYEEFYNNDYNIFVLTDEAAAKYLGDDGTQVGMYGGEQPFDTTPNNPLITKFNVSSKSSAENKLRVELEISSPQ